MKFNPFFFVDQARTEEMGILEFLKEEVSVKELLEIVFIEWLNNKTNYLGFSTANSFRDEVERYRENG